MPTWGANASCGHAQHTVSERRREGPEVTLGRVGLGAGGAGGPRRGPAVQAGLGGGRRVADTGAHGATVRDWQGPEQPHSVHRDRSVPGPFQVSNAAPDAAPHPLSAALHEPSFWKCSQSLGRRTRQCPPSSLMPLPQGCLWEVPDQRWSDRWTDSKAQSGERWLKNGLCNSEGTLSGEKKVKI